MAGGAAAGRLVVGWEALGSGEWDRAKDAFGTAVEETQGPEPSDGLGRALWWLGDVDGAIASWEQAYAGYRRSGDDARASRVALLLAREYADARGNTAAANGWLARARGLIGDDSSAELGWLRLVEAQSVTDPSSSLELGVEALRAGRDFADADLELCALGAVGLAEIALGRTDEGMSRFDEAMAAATAGEPRDLRTLGDLYCSLTLACELTLDMARFGQWNDVVMGFMQRHNHPALFTFCGTCCAEVLGAAGQWDEGERWLTDTLRTLESTGQRARCVHPATQLALRRIQQGRLEEAEALLHGFEDLPEAVHPQVRLYLARGETAMAAARLHRRLNEVGRDNLVAVPLLALLVEVQSAQGDLDGAAQSAEGIRDIGRRSGRDRVEAEAELAIGSVKIARGDAGSVAHLDRAIELFSRLRMPHGAARAHLALGRGHATVDRERAIAEARQALRAFEDLGATRDADAAAACLRELGVAGRTGPKGLEGLSKREVEVLRLLGEGLTNAEIAARLYISTKTVATHVGNIFAKLQLRNRAEAVAYSLRYLAEAPAAT